MRAEYVCVAFVALVACASDPPPKAAEPQAAPLEIPPLPPQKEPAPRPMTREVPPLPPPEESNAQDLAPPSPLALPCKSDAECATHRCNLQYGKCAFPCVTDRDCIAGATCFAQSGAMAVCIPKAP